jgi:hypothetical protein
MVLKLDAFGGEGATRKSNIYVGAILRTVCRAHHKIRAVYTEIDSRKEIMDLLDIGLQWIEAKQKHRND